VSRSPHTTEFRQSAAAEVERRRVAGHRRTVSAVAAELGISPATLRQWTNHFPRTPEPDPNPQPDGGKQAEPRPLPLLGIGRHSTCGTRLSAALNTQNRPVYTCTHCPHRPAIPADVAHLHALAAVARHAPRLAARLRPDTLSGWLTSIQINDRGATVALTWRPIHATTSQACR